MKKHIEWYTYFDEIYYDILKKLREIKVSLPETTVDSMVCSPIVKWKVILVLIALDFVDFFMVR